MKTREHVRLEIKRLINAPRDRVYGAWTDPEQLKQWFGPANVDTHGVVADVRPGGKFQWDLSNSDGERMTVLGEYVELVPPQKVVFTWRWDDDELWENHNSMVTVELSDAGGGTELRLTHEQLPTEQSRDNHVEGWKSALDKLENFVSQGR